MKILYKDTQIEERIIQLAQEIDAAANAEGVEDLVAIVVLNGAYMFASDLTKALKTDCFIEFIKVSSYGDEMVSSGDVKMNFELSWKEEYDGLDILIIEDIVDTGRTIKHLKEYLSKFNPNSIKVASMLWKDKSDIRPDYYGFKLDADDFVVGRGLDHKGALRNLKCIWKVEKIDQNKL